MIRFSPIVILTAVLFTAPTFAGQKSFTNSIGLKMLKIPAGSFSMGSKTGDFDETPRTSSDHLE